MSKIYTVDRLELGVGNAVVTAGTADPTAGAGVTAPVGSLYLRTGLVEIYLKTGAAATAWSLVPVGGGSPLGVFGDGSDGSLTVVGTQSLVRNSFYNNVTIPTGTRLDTANFNLHVKGTLTIDAGGVLSCNGNAAIAGAGGVGLSGGSISAILSGTAGGNGGTSGNGTAGGAATSVVLDFLGRGGSGGNGTVTNGGVGGVLTYRGVSEGDIRQMPEFSTGAAHTTGSIANMFAGSGGGGGGGAGAGNQGGGGGSGAGCVSCMAQFVVNNGSIEARGGVGAAGLVANTGGGGGGGGGIVLLMRVSRTGNLPVAPGGAPGASGGAGGVAGSTGVAGLVFEMLP
jgi:hypothetical protein